MDNAVVAKKLFGAHPASSEVIAVYARKPVMPLTGFFFARFKPTTSNMHLQNTLLVLLVGVLTVVPRVSRSDDGRPPIRVESPPSQDLPGIWKPVTTDLWSAQVTLPGNAIFSSELLAFRSTLTKFSVAILKASEVGTQRSTVRYLADSAGAVVAVNGSFFDEYGKPLGLIVARGILTQPLHKRGNTLTSVFAIGGGRPQIRARSEFSPASITEAIQAGPRLLKGGSAVPGLDERDTITRRSGLCIDRGGALVMFATSSRLRGVTLSQLQQVLPSTFGCVDAINLDGGGSSQMFFRGFSSAGIESISLDGQDLVPNAIGLLANQ